MINEDLVQITLKVFQPAFETSMNEACAEEIIQRWSALFGLIRGELKAENHHDK